MNEVFSERLRCARTKAGMKAKHLAAICGISASYLSELETGRRANPANILIEKLASECGVTVDWLLGTDKATIDQLRDRVSRSCKRVDSHETHNKINGSVTSGQGVPKLEKGCRYPEGCDLEGDMQALRDEMAYMRTQLDTVVGLLGAALGDGIKTTRPREGERKAG